MSMITSVTGYDETTRTVAVTFTSGEIVHTRNVNAVLTEAGAYDPAATAERVEEVARGVAVKIGLGVIAAAEPASEAEA